MTRMIEVKVSELEGAALDWAVAVALGWQMRRVPNDIDGHIQPCYINQLGYFLRRWSSDWNHGGPLLEKYYIEISIGDEEYWANRTCTSRYDDEPRRYPGGTMLIAACRTIVAAKLGDTVQVPEELVDGDSAMSKKFEKPSLLTETNVRYSDVSKPAEAEGGRNYLVEFCEGEVEAKTALTDLQADLSAVTAERDALLERVTELSSGTVDPADVCAIEEERDQLRAEVEALRKDAERYRFIRDSDELPMNLMRLEMMGELLDNAIDAAMAAKEDV